MTFWVKLVEDWSFDKRLSQLSKRCSSSRNKKVRFYHLFGLKQIFRCFSIIFLNLIISNLTAINLNIVHPTSIKLTISTFNSTITTNPDYTLS